MMYSVVSKSPIDYFTTGIKTSIVTQLNASLDALVLKDTLEKRLKNKGALIAMKLSRATRRGKQSLLDRVSMLDIRKDEVESLNSLK